MLTLKYDRGTIVLSQEGEGRRSDGLMKYGNRLPVWLKWDADRCVYRALAYKYRELASVLKKIGVEFIDEVMKPLECPKLDADIELYDFQKDALDEWLKRRAGSLVIPTGGGKTIVAMRAMAALSVPTLVIAPTLESGTSGLGGCAGRSEYRLASTPAARNGSSPSRSRRTIRRTCARMSSAMHSCL